MAARYIINVEEGRDVAHDSLELTEKCNTDDIGEAEGRRRVSVIELMQMIGENSVRLCRHCMPLGKPQVNAQAEEEQAAMGDEEKLAHGFDETHPDTRGMNPAPSPD